MTKLSVNLNKVALLRNQRDIGYPDLAEHAQLVLEAGANGLTIHPRPDERHIRYGDVALIGQALDDFGDETCEFNIEGYPDEKFLELVCASQCDQVTLVPDPPHAKTSDTGWRIRENHALLHRVIGQLKDAKKRVSLFIDPEAESAREAYDIGADRVELYTGPYAFAHMKGEADTILPAYKRAGEQAHDLGMGVNAGHDLNLDNLEWFLDELPYTAEVSIGHAITDDALKYGWARTVALYGTLCNKKRRWLAA